MNSHLELSDKDFEKQFRNYTLDPKLFNHEAHLRLAWIHLNKYGLEISILNLKKQLKDYVANLGQLKKYDDALTEAATRAVYHFTLKSNSNNFTEFIAEFPKLKNDFKALMDDHYAGSIYTSDIATKNVIEPDLLTFD